MVKRWFVEKGQGRSETLLLSLFFDCLSWCLWFCLCRRRRFLVGMTTEVSTSVIQP